MMQSIPTFADEVASLQEVLELHRKVIFLIDNEDAHQVARERDTFIARNFYVAKRRLLESLEEKIVSDQEKAQTIVKALIQLTQDKSTRAADVLAFMDLVDTLAHKQNEQPFLTADQQKFLKNLGQEMELIQDTYSKNLSEISKKLQTRGLVLEQWEEYLRFINGHYDRDEIHREFNQQQSELAEPATRGAESKKDARKLVWGFNVPEKTVVLTFDDGPHYRNTGKVLDILKANQVHGYFFAVGRNIGKIREGKVVEGTKAKILRRALSEGHLIANHSYSHAVLTKLDRSGQQKELNHTNMLLQSVSGYENKDFRPPYGSKNQSLLALSVELGMRAVMWNIDSMDWADPVPDSIVKRVMERLKKDKKGILLFHDIHKQTVQALPKLLKTLKQEGYRIVTIDGKDFNSVPQPVKPEIPVVKSELYGDSWALVIGVNEYEYWPKLNYAVNDAKGVAEVLREQYGFKSDHIFELYDENATRGKIAELLSDTLADPSRVKPNDRVFVFYAGHGMTRSLPSGRKLGYIIPVNAELIKFSSNSISMTHLQDFSEMIPAKHVYFIMDSCYSGIALTRGGGSLGGSKYLSEIASRRARQILTAGGADQEVADGGPQGHSIFTWTLLQGLKGDADIDNNHVITASELGAFITPKVSNNSSQTPIFGNLVGSEGGDFIFELSPLPTEKEGLTEEQKLHNALLALEKENASLKQQMAQQVNKASKKNKGLTDLKAMSPAQRKEKAIKLHRKGLREYKASNFDEALKTLHRALTYNPSNVSLVNDYGYILYRNGQLEKALEWLEKTIEMDAERIPVYLNIADTLAELKRSSEAVPYYQYYLSLYVDSPVKERVDKYLKAYQ
jgi:peptidoglycan/xylan/chitin deacetylase (PgdA/CDA1 family)/tetratricopeptide (TPR) repeat protein